MANPDLKKVKPRLLISLNLMQMPYRAYIQGGIYSSDGNWYVLNSGKKDVPGAGGRETSFINKFDKKGKYLGRMTLIGGGHGSTFSMRGGTVMIGWDESNGDRHVRAIAWKKNDEAKIGDADLVTTTYNGDENIRPLPLEPGDYFSTGRAYYYKEKQGYYEFRRGRWSSRKTLLNQMRIKQIPDNKGNAGVYQGSCSFGDSMYVIWGATVARPQRVVQYKWPPTGSALKYVNPHAIFDVTDLGRDKRSKEPEGLSVYGGQLLYGQRLGPTSNRSFEQYVFAAPTTPAPPSKPTSPPPVPPDKCSTD